MKPVTDAVPDIGVRARRFSLRSPPAWCVVQWPINCSHKGKISIFPGTKIARLIAAAGKPCSPHLLTTLSFIPFCFFPVSLSANHQALQVFFFTPALTLSRFTSFHLQSFRLHQTAIVWAQEENAQRKKGAGNAFWHAALLKPECQSPMMLS